MQFIAEFLHLQCTSKHPRSFRLDLVAVLAGWLAKRSRTRAGLLDLFVGELAEWMAAVITAEEVVGVAVVGAGIVDGEDLALGTTSEGATFKNSGWLVYMAGTCVSGRRISLARS